MRYTVNYESTYGRVEALPRGTSRQDGQTFVEAKNELIEWLRQNRDAYAKAAKDARKITRASVRETKS